MTSIRNIHNKPIVTLVKTGRRREELVGNLELVSKCNDTALIESMKQTNSIPNDYNVRLDCNITRSYKVDINKSLGEGGNNVVYEIVGSKSKVFRLVKFEKADTDETKFHTMLSGFFKQAYLAHLCPQHICRVYDFGLCKYTDYTDGTNQIKYVPYAVLERLDRDIFTYIEERTKITKEQWYSMIQDMLEGLSCIHNNEYAHLDFKLENLAYNIDKTKVKIFDFDTARYFEETIQPGDLLPTVKNPLVTSEIIGTLEYLAPEAKTGFQNEQNVDVIDRLYKKPLDVYALGICIEYTLYYILDEEDKADLNMNFINDYIESMKRPEWDNRPLVSDLLETWKKNKTNIIGAPTHMKMFMGGRTKHKKRRTGRRSKKNKTKKQSK